MTLPLGSGIIVDGDIVDPDRFASGVSVPYKQGLAKGLPRFEIRIVVSELRRIISAFPNHYTFPVNCKENCYVNVTLVVGQAEYSGKLSCPPSRLQDLYSGKTLAPKPQWREPWISARLKDKNGRDDKLVRALKHGDFESAGPVKLRVLENKIWV